MTTKQRAMLKHRLIMQAALCAEDLLQATEKDGGRPWIAIIHEHMESLFPPLNPRKAKPKKEIVYNASPCGL